MIKTETQFSYLQYYIHHNARKHGIVKKFQDHDWNSWHELISQKDTFLDRDFIFDYFGCKESFIAFHNDQQLSDKFEALKMEE
ncbi:MAG: hypothetical protein HKN76_16480 [Saprospiraceae bacterium]|nr:hypothetical protein [Saprospiraceae bacterium]